MDGHVKVSINKSVFFAEAGEIIFVNSCTSHSVESVGEEKACTCSIVFDKFFITNHTEGFDTSYIYNLFLNSQTIESRITKNHPLWDELNSKLEDICFEYEHENICYDMVIKSKIYRIIAILLRYYKNTILKGQSFSKYSYDFNTLKPVLTFIDSNYKGNLEIDDACRLINMSKYYFCRFFKQVTSMTFVEYVNSIRVIIAQKLLLDTNMTIAQISEEVGFHDPSYFNRVFKKVTGISPRNFRQSIYDVP